MFDTLKALKEKATELAAEHSGVVGKGLEKIADVVDGKTDGKYSDKIDAGVEKAKGFIDKLEDKRPSA
ncbi:antitoxin [Streptomyces sp. BPTC-684]|uniref:antitoxin n=1 Tax=Streptomyces sp. BPTC-684 TaxID=3043734 RepID=UPI0024B106A8|nr:antitoxin [Streptomyces sp. BPTC-684]WHM41055.1 antitoxin [Streptomyces sp. BPTC-684]